ncbi:late embryogenesis abundant protein At1g64065-like [Curcuma longa]|uniref:late embryogenesis abundant protein At1g64065-like n=1 Tax=Curcuma longa TaxID=136217 RepID=UPI003D9DB5AD
MVVNDTDRTKTLAIAPAPPSTSISEEDTNDTESLQGRSAQCLRRRRSAFWCCGCCGVAVIVLGITALVLAFTLLRLKDPKLAVNSLAFGGINEYLDGDQVPNINLIFYADVSLKNPNLASFRFRNSTTALLYNETVVGLLYAPAGEVGADRTVRMNVTLVLLLIPIFRKIISSMDRLAPRMEVELRSRTPEVAGRMNVLGVYKRDVAVMIMCDSILVSVDLENFKVYINSPEERKKPRCSADVR